MPTELGRNSGGKSRSNDGCKNKGEQVEEMPAMMTGTECGTSSQERGQAQRTA